MIAVEAVSKNNRPDNKRLLLYPHNRRLGVVTVNLGELTDLAEDLQIGKLLDDLKSEKTMFPNLKNSLVSCPDNLGRI